MPERFSEQNFQIYPIPAGDKIKICTGKTGTHKVSIISMTGRVIHSLAFSGNEKEVDLSTLREGMYFIAVNSNGSTSTWKLVKW